MSWACFRDPPTTRPSFDKRGHPQEVVPVPYRSAGKNGRPWSQLKVECTICMNLDCVPEIGLPAYFGELVTRNLKFPPEKVCHLFTNCQAIEILVDFFWNAQDHDAQGVLDAGSLDWDSELQKTRVERPSIHPQPGPSGPDCHDLGVKHWDQVLDHGHKVV